MEETLEKQKKGQHRFDYEKQRFSRSEASLYLGVSVVTVDRAIAKGKLSFFRIGRRVVLDKTHLDAFLKGNEYIASDMGMGV